MSISQSAYAQTDTNNSEKSEVAIEESSKPQDESNAKPKSQVLPDVVLTTPEDLPIAEQLLAESYITNASFDRNEQIEKYTKQLDQWQREVFRVEQYLQTPEGNTVFNNQNYIDLLSEIIEDMNAEARNLEKLIKKNQLLYASAESEAQSTSEIIKYNQEIKQQTHKKNVDAFLDLKSELNNRINHYENLITQLSQVSYSDLYNQIGYQAKIIFEFPLYLNEFKRGFKSAITQFENDIMVWQTYPVEPRPADIITTILLILLAIFLFKRIYRKVLPYYANNNETVNQRNAFIFFHSIYMAILPIALFISLYLIFFRAQETEYINITIIARYALITITLFLFLVTLGIAYKIYHKRFDTCEITLKKNQYIARLFMIIIGIIFANSVVLQIFIFNISGQSQYFITLTNLIFATLLVVTVFKLFLSQGWTDLVARVVTYDRAMVLLNPVMYTVLAITIISAIMGYITLAHHFIFSFVFSSIIIMYAFLLRSIYSELISYIIRIKALRMKYGFTILSLQKFKFWSLSFFNLILFITTSVILLLVWGFPAHEFAQFASELYNGFKLGELNFSLKGFFKAVLVFYIVIAITKYLRNLLRDKILPQSAFNPGTQNTITTMTSYVGWIIGFSLSFATLGIGFQNIAIIAGALSVGIGFGLQNVVNNFVSGLILLFEQPIKVGDWIRVGEHEGYVQKLNIRSTELKTFKRSSVIIPNADLISQPVMNMTFNNTLGRVEVPVSVNYKTDLGLVRRLLLEIADRDEDVLHDPKPEVLFMGYNTDRLDLELRCFIEDINALLAVSSNIRFGIFDEFKKHSIELPLPQQILHMNPKSEDKPSM